MSERPEECDGCHYRTKRLDEYVRQDKRDATKWLCDLCAGTAAGTAYDYPSQFPESRTLFALSYIGNTILDAVRKGKRR